MDDDAKRFNRNLSASRIGLPVTGGLLSLVAHVLTMIGLADLSYSGTGVLILVGVVAPALAAAWTLWFMGVLPKAKGLHLR